VNPTGLIVIGLGLLLIIIGWRGSQGKVLEMLTGKVTATAQPPNLNLNPFDPASPISPLHPSSVMQAPQSTGTLT
jgi:hypothetical protein